MNGVNEKPVLGGPTGEAYTGVGITGTFGHVDMHSDSMISCDPRRCVKGVIATGERGVDTDESPSPLAKEPLVLFEPSPSAIGTMSVRNAITAHDTNANGFTGLGYHAQ